MRDLQDVKRPRTLASENRAQRQVSIRERMTTVKPSQEGQLAAFKRISFGGGLYGRIDSAALHGYFSNKNASKGLSAISETAQDLVGVLYKFLDSGSEAKEDLTAILSECSALKSSSRELARTIKDLSHLSNFPRTLDSLTSLLHSLDFIFNDAYQVIEGGFADAKGARPARETDSKFWSSIFVFFRENSGHSLDKQLENYQKL